MKDTEEQNKLNIRKWTAIRTTFSLIASVFAYTEKILGLFLISFEIFLPVLACTIKKTREREIRVKKPIYVVKTWSKSFNVT